MFELKMVREPVTTIRLAVLELERDTSIVYHTGVSIGVENKNLGNMMATLAEKKQVRLHQRRSVAPGNSGIGRLDFIAYSTNKK